ncbi:MAG: hypothetical protein GX896_09660, partial [Clostridiales bacterium]|nr:hypothetical protein [Clostridiales bacterium]
MRIFINEIIKVFSKKSVIAIMLVLVILNSVILNVNENNRGKGYKPSEYRAICNDLESMTTQNAYENVSQKLKKLYMFTLFESGESAENNLFTDSDSDIKKAYEEYKSGNYLEYTNAIFSEIRLYTQLKNELESCTKYAEYLQSINDNAEKMISMSIFSEPGTFSYNNISKTPQAYENLKGTKLEFGASSGVKMATSFLATDIIAVIMIMVIVSTLVTKEKELCQLGLVKTTYKGRYCL